MFVCNQNATDEETCEDQRRADRTQIEAAFLMRFGKQVAQRRTKRASQDKRQPNKSVREKLVAKYAATMIASTPAITSAPPSYPRPELSAKKSPRAAPSVFEKRIVIQ